MTDMPFGFGPKAERVAYVIAFGWCVFITAWVVYKTVTI